MAKVVINYLKILGLGWETLPQKEDTTEKVFISYEAAVGYPPSRGGHHCEGRH
jgi:hypothetical protein